MQLTKYTDLSLRVLMHLAMAKEDRATISEVADLYQVSRNHLVKVVHNLAQIGYVDSTKGRGGGISLACDPDEIILGDVIRAVEPSLYLVNCEAEQCPIQSACRLKSALDEAMLSFLKVLDSYTVADLTKNKHQLLKLIN